MEVIEQRAFARAIAKAKNIKMLLDHRKDRVLAETENGTLKLKEDNVGLRAEAVVTDPEVIAGAKAGRLRGWSFNMLHPKDDVEQRAEGLPLRKIHDLDMEEVSLIMEKVPIYSSTSVEIRAGDETEDVEIRGVEDTQDAVEEKKTYNAEYLDRLQKIKEKKFEEE